MTKPMTKPVEMEKIGQSKRRKVVQGRNSAKRRNRRVGKLELRKVRVSVVEEAK